MRLIYRADESTGILDLKGESYAKRYYAGPIQITEGKWGPSSNDPSRYFTSLLLAASSIKIGGVDGI